MGNNAFQNEFEPNPRVYGQDVAVDAYNPAGIRIEGDMSGKTIYAKRIFASGLSCTDAFYGHGLRAKKLDLSGSTLVADSNAALNLGAAQIDELYLCGLVAVGGVNLGGIRAGMVDISGLQVHGYLNLDGAQIDELVVGYAANSDVMRRLSDRGYSAEIKGLNIQNRPTIKEVSIYVIDEDKKDRHALMKVGSLHVRKGPSDAEDLGALTGKLIAPKYDRDGRISFERR